MIGGQDQKFYTVKDVPAGDLIQAYASFLKKNNKVKTPEWTEWVKTGCVQQLAPYDEDWLLIRIAAVARKIYLRGHLGVGALKHIFGGNQCRGVRGPHHRQGHGKIIRWSLQQLEALGVVKKDKKVNFKKSSRIITKQGQADLNRIATEVAQAARKQ